MRLWSLSPEYLDCKGLLALWREALLARKVILGKTKGYRHHPQLIRFKACEDPLRAIDAFLYRVHQESEKRGYCFNSAKAKKVIETRLIPVTKGQVEYEYKHLMTKLKQRDKPRFIELKHKKKIKVNSVFRLVKGDIERWEKKK